MSHTENKQGEIIEVVERPVAQQGITEKGKSFWNKLTKLQLVFLVAGLMILGYLAVSAFDDLFDIEDRMEARYERQDDDQMMAQAPAVSSQTDGTTSSSSATTASNESSTPVASSELDGTYTGKVYDETYTLTVKGKQASLETAEMDGEREMEQVIFDLAQKTATIDGELHTYTFDGKNLVFTEVDNDMTKDQLHFTKQ